MSPVRGYPEVLRVVAEALRPTGDDYPDAAMTELLRELFGAELAGAGDADLRGTASRRWADVPGPIDLGPGEFHQIAVEHPFTRAYRRGGMVGPLRLSDVLSTRDDRIRAVLGPAGVPMDPAMAIPLTITARHIRVVAVLGREPDFSALELRLARHLQPVLAGVYALRRLAAGPEPGHERDARPDPDTDVSLTARELAVLDLMTDGLIAVAIARQLGISPRTVGKHIENIYRKFGTHDRTSAVLRAQALGILPPYAH